MHDLEPINRVTPSDHGNRAAFCLLPSAFRLPPSAFRLLPSAFCLLPSAFCLLPSAFCLPPSAFCLLSTAHCLPQPIADDVQHQRVQAEWRTEIEPNVRPFRGEVGLMAFEIFGDVPASREEVRQQEDSRGTLTDTTGGSLRDRWFGEFEIGDLDDGTGQALSQLIGELPQIIVGGRQSAAVCDQQDSGGVGQDDHNNSGTEAPHSQGHFVLLCTKWIFPEQSLQATFWPRYLIETRSSSSQCGQSQ